MAEVIFEHKETAANGDIIEIRVFRVDKSKRQPEGVSYSMVFIRNGERVIGYDNFEGHVLGGSSHHKHISESVLPYEFVDEWGVVAKIAPSASYGSLKRELTFPPLRLAWGEESNLSVLRRNWLNYATTPGLAAAELIYCRQYGNL